MTSIFLAVTNHNPVLVFCKVHLLVLRKSHLLLREEMNWQRQEPNNFYGWATTFKKLGERIWGINTIHHRRDVTWNSHYYSSLFHQLSTLQRKRTEGKVQGNVHQQITGLPHHENQAKDYLYAQGNVWLHLKNTAVKKIRGKWNDFASFRPAACGLQFDETRFLWHMDRDSEAHISSSLCPAHAHVFILPE